MERLAKAAAPQNHASKVLKQRSPSFAIASSDRGVINGYDSFFVFNGGFPFSIWKEMQDFRIFELREKSKLSMGIEPVRVLLIISVLVVGWGDPTRRHPADRYIFSESKLV